MAWEITKDLLEGTDSPHSRVGYSEEHERIPVMAAVIGMQSELLPNTGERIPFRLKDDDGEVYYEGMLHDDNECRNQLSAQKWGEDDAGCTMIEVKRDGKWVLEIG